MTRGLPSGTGFFSNRFAVIVRGRTHGHSSIRQRQSVFMWAAILILGLAVFLVFNEVIPRGPSRRLQNSRFYSDDDGRTWFIDSSTQIPPFDHDGKSACEAEVYRCGTGKIFVAYLQKYADKQRNEIESTAARHPEQLAGLLQAPMLVKKPGDSTWLLPDAPGGSAEMKNYLKTQIPVCPEGISGITHVMPTDEETGARR